MPRGALYRREGFGFISVRTGIQLATGHVVVGAEQRMHLSGWGQNECSQLAREP